MLRYRPENKYLPNEDATVEHRGAMSAKDKQLVSGLYGPDGSPLKMVGGTLTLPPQNAVGEGGELSLMDSTGSNGWRIDNNGNNFRIFRGGDVALTINPTTHQVVLGPSWPLYTSDGWPYWHRANDGAGSFLDADLFDGVDSPRFVYGDNAARTGTFSDFNAVAASGFYNGSNPLNAPSAEDTWWMLIHVEHTGLNGYRWQLASPMTAVQTNVNLYLRRAVAGGWGSWSRFNIYDTWHAFNYYANWTDYLTGWPTGGYRLDQSGYVVLKGLVKKVTALAVPDNIALLPAGYIPVGSNGHIFPVSTATGFAEVRVNSNGTVTLQTAGSNTYVSLDGIRFDPST